ncbi:MAG: hypothetical protein OXH53_09490 [bacterium]|nr:hypothetical protein [bacterium]
MDIPAISARNLPFVIDALLDFPDDPRSGLVRLLDVSEGEAGGLFDAARLLGLIDAGDRPADLASLMRTASLVARRDFLRHYLERFHPYADWKRRLGQGFDELEAARQIRAIHSIEQSPAQIRDRFIDLGTYCGSISENATGFVVTKGAEPDLGRLVSSIINDSQSAEEVLIDYLGTVRVWEKLPSPVREHLLVAMAKLTAADSPDEAVREAGLAMDKYMEDVGNSLHGGYSGMTMGQSAQKLLDDAVLCQKHRGYTEYGTKLRNAAEHPDTDAELNGDSWSFSARTAVTYVRSVLDFIRSADAAVEGRHEL